MIKAENLLLQQKDHKLLVSPSGDESYIPNYVWREKVVQWCYDVADHLNEDRSVVYVAMNILDRFCASTAILQPINEKMYEIASLSSIFIAVRISGSGELLLQELMLTSQGGITMEEIIASGTSIISTLSWEHRIVTPTDFVESIFQQLPLLNNAPQKEGFLDSAAYLIELAVCDVFLSHCNASSLAVAAILNALEANFSAQVPMLIEAVLKATSIAVDFDEIALLCTRLHSIYSQSMDSMTKCRPHLILDDETESSVTFFDHGFFDHEGISHVVAKRVYEVVSEDVNIILPLKRSKFDH